MKKILLVLTVLLLSPLAVFAETKNESMEVTATIESDYNVTIPKKLEINPSTKTANYTIQITGDLQGDKAIQVTADSSFTMHSAEGKAAVTATVTQTKNTWSYFENTVITGTINAPGLTAGTWTGNLNFEVKLIDTISFEVETYGTENFRALENMTWEEWINSGYNTAGYKVSSYNDVMTTSYIIVNRDTNVAVKPTDKIIADHLYTSFFD